MKYDVEIISTAAGGIGGLLKGLLKYEGPRKLILHVIVASFLGLAMVQVILFFFDNEIYTNGFIAAIGWASGFFSHLIVPRLESLIGTAFQSAENKVRELGDCEIEECDVDKLDKDESSDSNRTQ